MIVQMKTIYTRKIKQCLTVAGLSLLLPVTLAAESEKKLYEMSYFELLSTSREDPCILWLLRARGIYSDIKKAEDYSPDEHKKDIRAAYPKGSVGFVLQARAIDQTVNGNSKEEVARLVLEKCREYKYRYVADDSKENGYYDQNPEKK